MKHFDFEKDWDSIKGHLKKRFDHLTEHDLAFAHGKDEELVARLRKKLDLSAKEFHALLDELRDDAAGTLDHMKTKVGEFADGARAKAGEVTDALKTKAATIGEEAKVQAAAAYESARKGARNLLDESAEYVRHNPRQSLLAAACAGFVAGLLIRR